VQQAEALAENALCSAPQRVHRVHQGPSSLMLSHGELSRALENLPDLANIHFDARRVSARQLPKTGD